MCVCVCVCVYVTLSRVRARALSLALSCSLSLALSSRYMLGDDGVAVLMRAIAAVPSLTMLDLCDNLIGKHSLALAYLPQKKKSKKKSNACSKKQTNRSFPSRATI